MSLYNWPLYIVFYLTLNIQAVFALDTKPVRHLFDITAAKGVSLVLPSDVAVAPDGRIYVVDGGNHRVVIYKSNGKLDSILGSKGSGKGQFLSPIGIAVDNKGQVYVADSGNYRIQIFDDDEDFVKLFQLKEKNIPIKPIDIAVSPDRKTLYVSGNNNHKVMLFNAKGKLKTTWGKEGNNPGEFRYPATITVAKDGAVYVVDVLNSRVQIFEPDGYLRITAGSWGVLPGQLFRPKGVALDQHENIYVSDSYLDVIQIFNNETKFSSVLGANNKAAKFIAPTGIIIDKKNRIYITEMFANKISVYQFK